MAQQYTGKCQCGAVNYSLLSSPKTTHACHCFDCQKRTGSAFGISMVVAEDDLVLNGELKSFERIADSGFKLTQFFCPNCGNPIYGLNERRPNIVVLFPGTLNDTSWFEMERVIWKSRAQAWCPIPDGIEVFEESQPF